MNAAATVRAYYDALRAGDPLHPFFADGEETVKVGIGNQALGADAIETLLTEQTETTAAWEVDSRDLRVTEHDSFAHFFDEVYMGWASLPKNIRYGFETRWTGTLVPGEDGDENWQFVSMHVSTPARSANAGGGR
ncbi:nuclear transport factor 2 family protein [Natronomonas sp. EA1]|uniref:nuclear transport factor 2 family protein n=1 Tax=Natronomonas sp. EA1 TaxID=3421655 RepID=UPI003EC05377